MEANEQPSCWLETGQQAMEIEAQAIARAALRLDGNFSRAVELILGHSGKLVVTGLGKSGHVARKIVATLCSTGTPAVFLHAAEASHGDLGIYAPGDPTLMVSKSGGTPELLHLIPFLRELGSQRIGILGNPCSPLAAHMDVVLDGSVEREADPGNLAPTASTAVALALGHALAVALIRARNFGVEDFGRYHPGGQLGRTLRLTVREVMHRREEVAWASPEDSLKQVVIAMTHHPHGAACVIDSEQRIDGDRHRWRCSPGAASSRRYPRTAGRRRDDRKPGEDRSGSAPAGCAAPHGGTALPDFRAAGCGWRHRGLFRPAAAARYLSSRSSLGTAALIPHL